MHACAYIFTYIHTNIHTYISMHVYIHVYSCLRIYSYMLMLIHIYIHAYARRRTWEDTPLHTFIHTHAHTYKHTYIHAHARIHKYNMRMHAHVVTKWIKSSLLPCFGTFKMPFLTFISILVFRPEGQIKNPVRRDTKHKDLRTENIECLLY